MARQLIVQAHFLHLTSHAIGRPRPRPVMPPIIGEQKGKIHLLRGRRSGRSASLRKVQQPRWELPDGRDFTSRQANESALSNYRMLWETFAEQYPFFEILTVPMPEDDLQAPIVERPNMLPN